VLNVQAPTPEQVVCIAQTIYGRMRAEASWGGVFEARLGEDVLHKLQALPPRTLGLTLRRALGSAARAERTCVTVEDLPTKLAPARRGIGFMAALSD
jgi:ATP-dependent Lon protease